MSAAISPVRTSAPALLYRLDPQTLPEQPAEGQCRSDEHAGAETVAARRAGADHLADGEQTGNRRARLVADGDMTCDVSGGRNRPVDLEHRSILVQRRVYRSSTPTIIVDITAEASVEVSIHRFDDGRGTLVPLQLDHAIDHHLDATLG